MINQPFDNNTRNQGSSFRKVAHRSIHPPFNERKRDRPRNHLVHESRLPSSRRVVESPVESIRSIYELCPRFTPRSRACAAAERWCTVVGFLHHGPQDERRETRGTRWRSRILNDASSRWTSSFRVLLRPLLAVARDSRRGSGSSAVATGPRESTVGIFGGDPMARFPFSIFRTFPGAPSRSRWGMVYADVLLSAQTSRD